MHQRGMQNQYQWVLFLFFVSICSFTYIMFIVPRAACIGYVTRHTENVLRSSFVTTNTEKIGFCCMFTHMFIVCIWSFENFWVEFCIWVWPLYFWVTERAHTVLMGKKKKKVGMFLQPPCLLIQGKVLAFPLDHIVTGKGQRKSHCVSS